MCGKKGWLKNEGGWERNMDKVEGGKSWVLNSGLKKGGLMGVKAECSGALFRPAFWCAPHATAAGGAGGGGAKTQVEEVTTARQGGAHPPYRVCGRCLPQSRFPLLSLLLRGGRLNTCVRG